MNIVQYGSWKISVDVEKTKQYYASLPLPEDQASRNFAEYCKELSPEEQAFFDSLGIDPVRCKVHGIGVSKKGDFPCAGKYLFCGSYLECPPENLMTIEELAAKGFVDDRPDPRVSIGMFQFDFLREHFAQQLIPDQIPEGFLCVVFWGQNMKWLLKERCEEKMYELPRPWELHKRIADRIRRKKQDKAFFREQQQQFEDLFTRLQLRAVPLSKKERRRHRTQWLRAYAPADANWQELRELCLDSRGYSVFPWHIFSFEILSCEQENAGAHFDQERKDGCILLNNIVPLAYRVENAAKLTAAHLEEFIDVTITADDFAWTYSKTHEEMCGPYFYKRL